MSVMDVNNMQNMLSSTVVEAMSAFRTELMLIVMALLVSVFMTSTTSSLRKSRKRALEKKIASFESEGAPIEESQKPEAPKAAETSAAQAAKEKLVAFNAKLNAMAEEGDMEAAPQVLAEMKECGISAISANPRTLAILVKGYSNAGDMDKALPLFKELCHKTYKRPDGFTCYKVLEGCVKSGYHQDGLKIVDQMQKKDFKFGAGGAKNAVLLLAHAGRLDDAFKLVETENLTPSMDVHRALIEACFICRSPARACTTLRRAAAAQLHPDQKTMSMMAEGCLAHGNIDMALEVVRCAFQLPGHNLVELPSRPGVDGTVLRRVAFFAAKTQKSLYRSLAADLEAVGIKFLTSPLDTADIAEMTLVRRNLPAAQAEPVLKQHGRWGAKPDVTCSRWRKAGK